MLLHLSYLHRFIYSSNYQLRFALVYIIIEKEHGGDKHEPRTWEENTRDTS